MKHAYPVRFRHHAAIAVAAVITACASLSLLAGGWGFAVVPVAALAVAAWVIRAGTDANSEELRVRALLGQRRINWSAVNELAVDPRGRVSAVLHSGASVPLTAVRAADLPRLVAASGQDLVSTPRSPD